MSNFEHAHTMNQSTAKRATAKRTPTIPVRPDDLLTVESLHEQTKLGPTVQRTARISGELKYTRTRGIVYYRGQDVIDWILGKDDGANK